MEFSLCLQRVIDRPGIVRTVCEGRAQPVPLACASGRAPARIARENSMPFAYRLNAEQTIARNRQAKIITSASDPARSQRCLSHKRQPAFVFGWLDEVSASS